MSYADGNITIGTSVDMYGINEGLTKIENSFRKLKKLSYGAFGIIAIAKFQQAALDAASSLVEVQNVVDVAFGDMEYKMERFANISVKQFGMSELAAKQTGGAYMEMGKALGLDAETASNMAIKLTALTGDFASFYNISQDYARVALSAVYTGETETLKRYGIVITKANLQEFAAAHGIEKKVSAMTSAEKTMLRYQYIIQATADMEGDFARTSNSWANQVRLLKEQWTVFLTTLGNGMTKVLAPLLRMLNALVVATTRFISVLGAILGKLFGIQFPKISSQLTGVGDSAKDSASGAADAEEDLADATGDAAKAAKKALAPWDDLNVLQQETSSGGSGSGGGGGDFDFPDVKDITSKLADIKDYTLPDINSLFDLGRKLSKALRDMLANIDWDKIYKAAEKFGTGLADFLNGLITPSTFAEVGKTIANVLNTILHAAFAFSERADWKNWGRSIAALVNAVFENFDFQLLAKTINSWANGILDMMITAIKHIDWKMIGRKIGEFLAAIDWKNILSKIGKLIWDAINAAIDVYSSMFKAAPVETAILTIIGLFKLFKSSLFRNLNTNLIKTSDSFALFSSALKGNADDLAKLSKRSVVLSAFAKLLLYLKGILVSAGAGFAAFGSGIQNAVGMFKSSIDYGLGLGSAIKNGLSEVGVAFKNGFAAFNEGLDSVSASLTTTQKVFGTAIAVFFEFFATKNLIRDFTEQLIDGNAKMSDWIGTILKFVAVLGTAMVVMRALLGPIGLAVAAITALVGVIVGVNQAIEKINSEAFDTAVGNIITSSENGTHSLDDYRNAMQSVADEVTTGLTEIQDSYKKFEDASADLKSSTDNISSIGLAMQSSSTLTQSEVEQLKSSFSGLEDQLDQLIDASYNYIVQQTMADYNYLVSQGEVTDAVKQKYADRIAQLEQERQASKDNVAGISEDAQATLETLTTLQEQGKQNSQEYAEAMQTFRTQIGEVLDITSQYSDTTDNYTQAINTAKDSFDRYRGSLNLGATDIENIDDMSTQFKTTIGEMQNAYDTASDAIKQNADEYEQSLSKMNLSDQDRAELLEEHKGIVNQKLTELKEVYTTNLESIQSDLVEIIPSAYDQLEKEYDARSSTLAGKLALGDKDTWIREQLIKFVNEAYGSDSDTAKQLESAFESLGVDGGVWASEASDQIIDNLFTTEKRPDYMGGTITTLNSNWQTILDKVGETSEAYAQHRGEDVINGFNNGVNDNADTSKKPIQDWQDDVKTWFHDSAMKYGSPSVTAQEFGRDVIYGFNAGINDNLNLSLSSIDSWMNLVKAELAKYISTNSTDGMGFSSMISTLLTDIDTQVTTFITTFTTTLTENIETVETTNILPILEWFTTNFLTPLQDSITLFRDTFLKNLTEFFDNMKITLDEKEKALRLRIENLKKYIDEKIERFMQMLKENRETITTDIKTFDENLRLTYTNTFNDLTKRFDDMIQHMQKSISDTATQLANLSTQIANTGGSSMHVSTTTVTRTRTPKLASGGVIPPNHEFMAILGDQKSGTNIEAPLDTIITAMRQALSSMNYGGGSSQTVNLQIDGQTLARLTVPYNLEELNRRGYNVDVLEG